VKRRAGQYARARLLDGAEFRGLHQARSLSREDLDSTITFAELMKFNVLRTVR
jgi:hypothetical protein